MYRQDDSHQHRLLGYTGRKAISHLPSTQITEIQGRKAISRLPSTQITGIDRQKGDLTSPSNTDYWDTQAERRSHISQHHRLLGYTDKTAM
jgi:hypothetical protein